MIAVNCYFVNAKLMMLGLVIIKTLQLLMVVVTIVRVIWVLLMLKVVMVWNWRSNIIST